MVSRRGFLVGTAGSAVAAGTSGTLIGSATAATNARREAVTATANASVSFYGPHQAGIELDLQAVSNFVAFDLKPGVNRESMRRWMSLLTDDISRLTRGLPVLADPSPELAIGPARFTANVGFGPALFDKIGLKQLKPESLRDLPQFNTDALRPEFSGGEVLLQIAADDPIVLSHGTRALVRDSMPFASVRWVQSGFAHSPGMIPTGLTHRNLMGQVDGTENPALGSQDFNDLVWVEDGPSWLQGGTLLVFRRIAMQLDTWDQLGTPEKEEVVGRKLSNGAPLTGVLETDKPDFEARHANGLKVIPDFAHIRRASPQAPGERFFRRPFSYELGMTPEGTPDVGLLWTAYQRDIDAQFLPVQRRLDELDLLNQWTLPIGSAVFAIAGGVSEGEDLAQALFS